jgi:hypothetical protein
MSKFNDLHSKIFATSGVIVYLVILLSSSSVQMEIFAAEPGGKALFDCTYDNDKNKEICCDSSNNTLKCIECDVDLQTEQKYNCKEVPPKSNDVQPPDLVEAPQNLDKPIQNFSESGSEY